MINRKDYMFFTNFSSFDKKSVATASWHIPDIDGRSSTRNSAIITS